MSSFDFFCSVVFVIEHHSNDIENKIIKTQELLEINSSNYEIILVDVSKQKKISFYENISKDRSIKNLSIYITKDNTNFNLGCCIGLDKSIGDFTFILNPYYDDIEFIPEMLRHAKLGNEIVIAKNRKKIVKGLFYKLTRKVFYKIYKLINGTNILEDIYPFRLLSRNIANKILSDKNSEYLLRHLPDNLSYKKKIIMYDSVNEIIYKTSFFYSFKKSLNFLISTSNAPIRLISILSIFGASINIIYSVYILLIAIFKKNIAEGWITLSLQQSGMFFLLSLFFLILSEYILKINIGNEEKFQNSIVDEFNSQIYSHQKKINIKEID